MGVSSVVSSIANALTGGVVDKAMGIVDKLVPDKTAAAAAKAELDKLRVVQDHEIEMATVQLSAAQIAVNEEEAKSSSVFVAGARPFILWMCGIGIGAQFVVMPVVYWVCQLTSHPVAPLVIDTGALMSLTVSMLGLAGYRTFEKTQGVARDNLK